MALAYSDLFTDIARRIVWETMANGGATLNPITGGEPASGYMVGGIAPSLTFAPGTIPGRMISELIQYIATNWTHGSFVGGWQDPDTFEYHFDISDRIDDRDFAIELGNRRGEIAIYDLAGKDSVYV